MSFASLAQPSFLFGITNDFLFDDDTVSEKDIFSWDNDNSELLENESQSTNSDNQTQAKDKEITIPQLPIGLGLNSFQKQTDSFSSYNIFSNMNVSFSKSFPRAQDYSSQESILKAFPHLQGVNDPNFCQNSISNNAHFYILRSSNDDNIHKAVKYQIWSTTAAGKTILSEAWNEFTKKGMAPEIYLIFTVVNTNHCLGIAKMTSDIKPNESFMYWWEPMKWFGTFQIKWLFLKDIHSSQFDHIKEDAFSTSSFINLKDSTKLTTTNGKEIVRTFHEYSLRSNIFESFAYMDQREDYIRLQRDSNSFFVKQFQECCLAYQKDPEGFSPQKKTQNNKKKYNSSNLNLAGQKIQINGNDSKPSNNKPSSPNNSNNVKKTQNNKNNQKKNQNNTKQTNLQSSLAEQFGIKTLNKKSKGGKTTKTLKPVEDTQEKKKENMTLTY